MLWLIPKYGPCEQRTSPYHCAWDYSTYNATHAAGASTAAAASKQTILGLGDILELYQTLNVMKKKKTQGNDIEGKGEEIRKLRTQLKEIEKKRKQEAEKVPTKEEKNKPPPSSSFLGNAGAYALVALASGVLTALIQKFITKV